MDKIVTEFDTDKFMDAKEASKFLGVSIQTLYIWTSKNKIPVYKLRNRFNRYNVLDLEKLRNLV